MNSEGKGIMLVFTTALTSGFSIFLNKFAVTGLNAFVFTTLKNVSVALMLFAIILLLLKFKEIKALARKDWLKLFAIGVIGGSTAFLLFFHGLSITTAVNAAFLHKTLFIFASVFAIFILKEKINWRIIIGGILAFAALVLLFGLQVSSFNIGDFFIMLAVVLWGLEITIAKHALMNLSGTIVAFGRMLFGSLIMLAFLAFTNQTQEIIAINYTSFFWIMVTSALLLIYVFSFYNGLKFLQVSKATVILLAAIPITALLSRFQAQPITIIEFFSYVLLVCGITIASFNLSVLKEFFKKWFLCKGLN